MTTTNSRLRLAALAATVVVALGACAEAGVESVVGMSLPDGTTIEVTVETPDSVRAGDDEALLYTARHTNPAAVEVVYAFDVAIEGCVIPGATDYDLALEGMGRGTWPGTAYTLEPGREVTSALQLPIPEDCGEELVLHAALADPAPGGERTVVEIPVEIRG